MYESVRIRGTTQLAAACDGALERASPPCAIDRRVGVSIEQTERDLRARAPQGDAERLAALIHDARDAGLGVGRSDDVAPIDPRMSCGPASHALGGDRRIAHGARYSDVARGGARVSRTMEKPLNPCARIATFQTLLRARDDSP